MTGRFFLPLLALAVLSLSGCGIPGGVAQLVKTAERSQEGGNAAHAPAPAPAETVQPAAYRDQPPAPAAAPRDDIQAEQLPPPR